MTREEAIDRLKEARAGHKEFLSVETLNMAIKALEQQPCEDCISRQAAIDATWFEPSYTDPLNVLTEVRDRLKALPSVTQKSGKWIMSDDGLYRPICDKCGAHPWKGYIPTVEEATEVFKYCPNCGAKMVEPQERSDKECYTKK